VILTDREIRIALRDRALVIDPQPDLTVAITSTSIDLTLSDAFAEWKAMSGVQIRPGAPGYSYAELAKTLQTRLSSPYLLKPKNFVLGPPRRLQSQSSLEWLPELRERVPSPVWAFAFT
jgi:dCTP deaminase